MIMSADTIWIAICTVLVFFMQTGFAMLETGFTRKKNSCNVIMKNIMDFAVGSIFYWILGFGIMFGATTGVVGVIDLFSNGDCSAASQTIPQPVFMAWQLVFCATSATIVSGAMAERTAFKSYLIYSAVMSAVVYPISGCWIWNANGWLAQLGFHDFAGGTAVHLLGGSAAFAGAAVLGARIGKYDKKKKSRAILGQNIPLAALGAFILWVSWFGFNGGSVVTSESGFDLVAIGSVFMNTILSSSACAVSAMIITWVRYGKSDITMTLNGIVAGLVAVTAGADQLPHYAALLVGVGAAFVMIYGIEFIDHICKVDDPVGAISVHGLCGAFGTIMTGVFSVEKGVIYTGRFNFLGVQLIGVLSVAVYGLAAMTLLFVILKHTVGIRVSEKAEIMGLDRSEHGWQSNVTDDLISDLSDGNAKSVTQIDLSKPIDRSAYKADGKIRKVVILMNSSKFESLKDALDEIDITGMTVTNVNGCGIQKGSTDYYRGSEAKSHLLPKIKVEIVISTVPLGLLVDTVKRVLYSGNIGDGKIFVYEVENVIKIRTDEEGKMALE
ncbi:MAG: ammonium transporter [Ruminococcus sp.]|nr:MULTISPECIES: ammonium transporter [Ruminococcus]RGG15538.1 ammonium transporter [Ruminococcus sp. AF26-25AA]RGI11146.1 ammonium transporter [Ruminococcus sp. TF12-2]RGI39491.1 ammonium transporter [Ruminococcus sp. OM07-17]MDR4040942.1 ammonium transporter [Ruminococcus sp.]MEE0538999.1 ammonium transporter [Ruminococcus sp.]